MKKTQLTLAFLCLLHFGYAQPGELDPAFGNKGIVATDMDSVYNYNSTGRHILVQSAGSIYVVLAFGNAVLINKKHPDGSTDKTYGNNGYSSLVPITSVDAALQNDGKIIVAGSGYSSPAVRFNADGSLDDAFNSNITQSSAGAYSSSISCVAIQSDGNIVLAGTYTNVISEDQHEQYVIASSYNTDGSLIISVSSNFGVDDQAFAIAVEDDNKIVVAGSAFIRYNSDLTIDTTLNGNGRQQLSDIFNGVAIQSDRKIIVAGNTIERYKNNGGIDSSFNGTGSQATLFGGAGDVANAVKITNGKIAIAGYEQNTNGNNLAVARFNADGSHDNSFSGDGIQIASFNGTNSQAYSMAIQGDGKLLAAGYTIDSIYTFTAIARYNTDGSPDNSFNNNGTLVDHLSQGSTFYTASVTQTDGKVVAAGYTWNGTHYDFALARYNLNGSLDNSFSSDGKQMLGFGSADSDIARALVIQNDGKIVVAGTAGSNFKVVRYNTDGSTDNAFNGNGTQTTDIGIAETVNSINIQSSGKILAGDGYWLTRYNSNGTLDDSFGQSGKLNTNPFKSYQAVIQPDDKIVMVSGGNGGCRIIRYNPDGSPDNSFGNLGNGVQSGYDFDQGQSYFDARSIAMQADGKIVIGGFYFTDYQQGANADFAVLRLNTNGSFDASFNGGVLLQTIINSDYELDYASSVKVESDNRIILAGYSFNGVTNDFAVVRYNTDGSLDNTFSNDGIQVTPASILDNEIESISINGNNLYAVGSGQYPGSFGVVARYLLAGGGVLPVSLTTFTAALQDNKTVLLKWQTESEQNLVDFTVEKSADGKYFSSMGKVAAKGNSNVIIPYSAVDKKPLPGLNYYRLKMADINGSFTYSKVAAITIAGAMLNLKVSPNPAKDILYAMASGDESGFYLIIDSGGKKWKEIKVASTTLTSFPIDISTLPPGIYTLQLQTQTTTATKRFIKE